MHAYMASIQPGRVVGATPAAEYRFIALSQGVSACAFAAQEVTAHGEYGRSSLLCGAGSWTEASCWNARKPETTVIAATIGRMTILQARGRQGTSRERRFNPQPLRKERKKDA
ncbi:hypothetical protein Y1Q_0021726 [Alligator mississippiensis]|uniref:Uncharacterized protein n=1 Tax=Alligator mississippiensis TaxID=8496 RepID=A0A151PAV5_ALLMI|nr:hypothetical protein Y1Q_0021726 [Alligator mississippiensis]